MTLYEKIKAMSLEEMAEFLVNFDMGEAMNEFCTRCERDHIGECPFDVMEKEDATCPFNDKVATTLWLAQVIETQPKEYYSPYVVRHMSRAEVKANFARILESMKHWD